MPKKKENPLFNKLEMHIGHNIDCVGYCFNGKKPYDNISIECIDCNEVLISEDSHI